MSNVSAPTLQATEAALKQRVQRLFKGSLHIRHVDAGSCNACESEIKMLSSPYYDMHRLGMFLTSSPRHADLLLVTGPVTRAMHDPLLRTYEAMPDPRLVAAVGACACNGGIFGPSAFALGGLGQILPVDVFIPGCPPTPLTLLHGLLLALGRVEQRVQGRTLTVKRALPILRSQEVDLVLFLTGWEAMAFLSYIVVNARYEEQHVIRASYLMLAISELGTIGILLAFLLLAQTAGTFSFAAIRASAPLLPLTQRTLIFLLTFFGFGAKIGVLPLQL